MAVQSVLLSVAQHLKTINLVNNSPSHGKLAELYPSGYSLTIVRTVVVAQQKNYLEWFGWQQQGREHVLFSIFSIL